MLVSLSLLFVDDNSRIVSHGGNRGILSVVIIPERFILNT